MSIDPKYRSTLRGRVTKALKRRALDVSLRDEVMQLVQTSEDIPLAIVLVLESRNVASN